MQIKPLSILSINSYQTHENCIKYQLLKLWTINQRSIMDRWVTIYYQQVADFSPDLDANTKHPTISNRLNLQVMPAITSCIILMLQFQSSTVGSHVFLLAGALIWNILLEEVTSAKSPKIIHFCI
jgi:hypothetical protein